MKGNAAGSILVTGASGVLGQAVISELVRNDVPARGTGRHTRPEGFAAEWQLCDLLQLSGVQNMLQGASTVIHCASSPGAISEERCTLNNLMTAARNHKVHIVYVSIAGIEPAASISAYYRSKLDGEAALQMSDLPHTIVRITQFHPFVSMILTRLSLGPFQMRSSLRLQPVDVAFAAGELVRHGIEQRYGRTEDVHGPERLSDKELVHTWLEAHDAKKIVVPIPASGPLKALGHLEEVRGITGGLTWSEWTRQNSRTVNPYLRASR